MKTQEEYETKIAELELKIEEMERTSSVVYGVLVGGLTYFQWHSLLIAIAVGLVTTYIVWKFIAKKPFTNGLHTDKGSLEQDD